MIDSIIAKICERKGWDKVNIRDMESFYDFPAGNLVGAKKIGDKWELNAGSGKGVTILYGFRQTHADIDNNYYTQRTEIIGDESHTYYPVANTNVEIAKGVFVESSKITISETPFRILLPSDLCAQYDQAVEKFRVFRIKFLLITPVQ